MPIGLAIHAACAFNQQAFRHEPWSAAAVITVEAVQHCLEEKVILAGLSCDLVEARIGIIGANGSGKSSFARLLNGLVIPVTGRVIAHGHDTSREGRAVRRKVGFVFQNPDHQIVYPIVEEDLAFGLKNTGLRGSDLTQRIGETLHRFRLEPLRHQAAHALSGGEKQLLALAGVIAMEPRTIVLDEPTTLLDLRNKRRIMEILSALPQQIILVTHDLDLLADFDRVLVFDHGRIAADGAPQPAISHYQTLMGA